MSTIAAQPFSGTYRAQPVPSSFAFAVRHSGVFWYRGSLSDVAATLRADGDTLALEGAARVESVSVVEPAAMRASVLGPEFFDAERHPEITFRSLAVHLDDDGLVAVDGELTIRGVTRSVSLRVIYLGQWQTPWWEEQDGEWIDKGPRLRAGFVATTEINRHSKLLQNPKPLIQYLKPQTSGEVAEWLKAAVC